MELRKFTLLGLLGTVAFANASVPSKFEVTPADGAVISELKTITIYGKTESDIFSYPNPDITINGKSVSVTSSTSGSESDLLTWTLKEPITAPGEYEIVVGEESFYYGWYEYDNSEMSWKFTIEEPAVSEDPEPFVNPSSVYMDPKQGHVNQLESFVITYTDIYMVDYNQNVKITLYDYNTNETVATGKMSDGPNMADALITLDHVVSTPGTYVLDIPEGAAYDWMDDTDAPATKWLYIVDGGEVVETPDNVATDPENGSVVESLEQVSVIFLDYDVIYMRQPVTATLKNSAGVEIASVTLERGKTANSVVAHFAEAITEQGKYEFVIPKNTIILGEDGDNARYNATVSLKFGVQPYQMPDIFENKDVTIYPVQGRYTSLSEFTLTFYNITLPDINYTKRATLVNDETNETVATGKASYGAIIQQIIVDLDNVVDAPGTYTLTMPEGMFYDSGSWDEEDLPELKFRYVVSPLGTTITPVEYVVEADPADNSDIDVLEKITLTYPEFDAIYRHEEDGIRVVDTEGNTVATGDFAYGDKEANQMLISFKPAIIDEGDYTVVIPKRAFILGDMKFAVFSSEVTLHYHVSGNAGVESIIADGEEYPVYNVAGIKVGTSTSIEDLPAGIYICNGQKLIIR